MNVQNAEFLKKSLLNLGFEDKLNSALENELQAGKPEFTLDAQREYNGTKIDYQLYFKAGKENEMYFFNKYDAKLNARTENQKDVSQTFYIKDGHGITAKEAYNLMEGRAVHKQLTNIDKEKYNAWVVLDKENLTEGGNMKLKQFHENYGFDIEKVITGKGIKELEDPKAKESLLYSLKKGNVQQVTVKSDDGDKKYFIAANPQFKTVEVFDHQMKRIKREELLEPEQKTAKNFKQGEQQKEDAPEKKQKRSKRIAA